MATAAGKNHSVAAPGTPPNTAKLPGPHRQHASAAHGHTHISHTPHTLSKDAVSHQRCSRHQTLAYLNTLLVRQQHLGALSSGQVARTATNMRNSTRAASAAVLRDSTPTLTATPPNTCLQLHNNTTAHMHTLQRLQRHKAPAEANPLSQTQTHHSTGIKRVLACFRHSLPQSLRLRPVGQHPWPCRTWTEGAATAAAAAAGARLAAAAAQGRAELLHCP